MNFKEWKIKRLCKKCERYCELYGKSVITKAICESIGLQDRIELISLDQILKPKSPTTSSDSQQNEVVNKHSIKDDYHMNHRPVDHKHFKHGKSHHIRRQSNKKTVIYTIESD